MTSPAAVATNLYVPGGDSPDTVHLTNVDCVGNETKLGDCPAEPGTTCDSPVGLICNVTQRKQSDMYCNNNCSIVE